MTPFDFASGRDSLVEAILASTTDRLTVFDPEGRIVYANAAAQRACTPGPGSLVGLTWRDLGLPEARGAAFEQRLRAVLDSGQPLAAEEGEGGRALKITLAPLPDSWGAIPYVLETVRDVTIRTRAEEARRESEARMRALLSAIPDLIFLLSRDGVFLDCSASDNTLLMAPPEVFLGRNLRTLMPPSVADRMIPALARALDTGQTQVLEYPLPVRGDTHHFETRIVPCGPDRLLAMARDITDRLMADEALVAAEDREHAILDAIPDLMFVTRRDGTFLDVHAPDPTRLPVPAEELLWKNVRDLFPPDLAERYLEAIGAALDQGRICFIEYETTLREAPAHFEARVVPCGPHQTLSVVRDISAKKATERDLAASEERFRTVAEQTGQVVYDYDVASGRIVWAGAIESITGERPEAFQKMDITEWEARIHPEDRPLAVRLLEDSLVRCAPYLVEYRFRHRDGSYRHLDDHGIFLPGPDGKAARMLGTMSDITRQREAGRAMAELQALLQASFEQSPNGMILMDPKGFIQRLNPASMAMLGLEDERVILGRSRQAERVDWKVLDGNGRELPPERLPLVRALGGEIVEGEELRVLRGDGTERWLLAGAAPIHDPEGNLLAALATFADITERTLAEEALKASEDRFRALCENTTDSIFWIGVRPGGSFVLEGANPAQLAAIGLGEADVLGRELHEILPPEAADTISANYRRCLEAGEPITYEEVQELAAERVVWQTVLAPVKDPGGNTYRIVGTSRNVTEHRRQEEILRQTQKLESLGVLAGGIAHDFNNLLTAVLGNLNLAQMKLPEEAPAQPHLEAMERTVLKAAELTRQMLAYSGKGRFVVKQVNLSRVVQETTQLLEVSIYKKIHLRYELDDELPAVEADPAQLQQVVMNLVINASDAIGDREGAIVIRTRLAHLDAGQIREFHQGRDLPPGPYVVLEVGDSGCGMEPATLAKIFDPFFTTKGSGRGLGLSAMLGILRGHRAGIRIRSRAGQGSTFEVFFRPAPAAAPRPRQESPVGAAPAVGTLLLVDDEPSILDSAQATLSALGFQVLTAQDGLEALEAFRAHPEIRAVLMDLTMPRMDGREAFLAMHALRPGVPVLITSGYSVEESVPDLQRQGLAGFLQKPYTIRELRAVLERALGPG